MDKLLYFGQWQGFFRYGPQYGPLIEGQEAEFRLFIEELSNGEFSGRVIDWEGIGANGEVSSLKGFINGNDVSFTKQYDQSHAIDEQGNCRVVEGASGHAVRYRGCFDKNANQFVGEWEIVGELGHATEVVTGTWRMKRHE